MPARTATIALHCDSDYDGHSSAECNFWVPWTRHPLALALALTLALALAGAGAPILALTLTLALTRCR